MLSESFYCSKLPKNQFINGMYDVVSINKYAWVTLEGIYSKSTLYRLPSDIPFATTILYMPLYSYCVYRCSVRFGWFECCVYFPYRHGGSIRTHHYVSYSAGKYIHGISQKLVTTHDSWVKSCGINYNLEDDPFLFVFITRAVFFKRNKPGWELQISITSCKLMRAWYIYILRMYLLAFVSLRVK